jgi:hypothetical protein
MIIFLVSKKWDEGGKVWGEGGMFFVCCLLFGVWCTAARIGDLGLKI